MRGIQNIWEDLVPRVTLRVSPLIPSHAIFYHLVLLISFSLCSTYAVSLLEENVNRILFSSELGTPSALMKPSLVVLP